MPRLVGQIQHRKATSSQNAVFVFLFLWFLSCHLLFSDHSDAETCLIALCCSYLISPSFSVTFIPKGFLNITLLRVPASLIFILNATITAAFLWPFTYWKGEWITRDPNLIDAKRCDKSAESSLFLSLPYLCVFSIPCRFYAGVFFRVVRHAEM